MIHRDILFPSSHTLKTGSEIDNPQGPCAQEEARTFTINSVTGKQNKTKKHRHAHGHATPDSGVRGTDSKDGMASQPMAARHGHDARGTENKTPGIPQTFLTFHYAIPEVCADVSQAWAGWAQASLAGCPSLRPFFNF